MRAQLFCCLALLGACASYPKPEQNLADSMATARGAEEAGAAAVPDAKLHLTLAQEEIETAKKLMKDEEYERADHMTLRASADAELALALAREEAAKREAQNAKQMAEKSKAEFATQASGSENP
jgi:hypothetical protein